MSKADESAAAWVRDHAAVWSMNVLVDGAKGFVAGIMAFSACGFVFKASHDQLAAWPPYGFEINDLPDELDAWGWTWREDEGCWVSFFPGG